MTVFIICLYEHMIHIMRAVEGTNVCDKLIKSMRYNKSLDIIYMAKSGPISKKTYTGIGNS